MAIGTYTAGALEYGDEWNDYTNSVQQRFTDVSSDYWAAENINRTVSKGWFEGYPDGTFHPDASISRAEAMTVFVKFLGLQLKNVNESTYYDVKTTDWYSPYIEAGKALFPVISAYNGETPFRPEMPITREDTVYALVTALRYSDDTVNADQSVLNMFSDKNSISEAVKPYVTVAVKKELVAGYPDGTIGAQDPLTRAEFATLLYRASFVGFGNSELRLDDDNTAVTNDNIAPVFDSIDYPASVTTSAAKIKGKVSDASGSNLTLDIDGRAVQIRNGAFESTVDVEIGTNTYLLTLTNATGKSTQRIVKIKRENVSDQGTSSSGGSSSQGQSNSSSSSSSSQNQGGNTNSAQSPTVVKYEWSVNSVEIEVGETATVKLMEVYSDGSKKDVTRSYTLSSSNISVATVSGGRITGFSDGTAKISFESGGIGASVSIPRPLSVTVKAPANSVNQNTAAVIGYEWSVASIEIEVGEAAQIKLIEKYSDGSKKDVTGDFELSSNNTDVASVLDGIVTGVSAGTAKISFSSNGVGATVSMPRQLSVTVKAASQPEVRLTGLEWSTRNVTVRAGETATLRLYGVYSDGSKKDLTDECEVYADEEDIAIINGTTVRGIKKGTTEAWFSSVPGSNLNMPGVVEIVVTD